MLKRTVLILIYLFTSLTALHSQTWKIVGNDIEGEAEGDQSGYSVSLSNDGSVVAIGAISNSDVAFFSGHVRIFENQGGTWTQMGQDIDGEAEGDQFGTSVSLSSDGSIIAIGTPFNDSNGHDAGQVRIYQYLNNAWTQIGKNIDGEAADDQSGEIVSLSDDGTIVAIGASLNGGSGFHAGHVRIYKNIVGTWTKIGQDIDGEASGDYSGTAVSLSSEGSIVAIGAPSNGTYFGHVRIFENQNGVWVQIGQDIDGEASGDQSGISVSLSNDGSIVAIGANNNGGNGPGAGHVRIYKNESGTWTQIGQDIDGEASGDASGSSVSINSDGSIVAIGAFHNDGNGTDAGHVRIYQFINETWVQIGEDIDGEAAGDWSGISVNINSDGSLLAIGASYNDGDFVGSGHVRVYKLSTTEINNLSSNVVTIYPNPTNDILNININEKYIYQITIFDITGKLIIRQSLLNKSEMINLSNLKKGVYIISLQSNEQIINLKIIKK